MARSKAARAVLPRCAIEGCTSDGYRTLRIVGAWGDQPIPFCDSHFDRWVGLSVAGGFPPPDRHNADSF